MKIYFIVISFMYSVCTTAIAATCDNGWYMDNENCVQCPQNYPNSVPNATSINDCYLITETGKYVATAGTAPVPCLENHYCPGNAPVFYDLAPRFINVEYIHGTGTQYIDTGIILGSDIDTEMVFEAGNISGDVTLFGAMNNDLHYWLNGFNNNMYIRYNDYHPRSEYKAHIMPGKKSTLAIKSGDWIFDGKSIYTNSGTFNVGLSGYLFALHRTDDGDMWIHPSLKFYSFKQWRDGELIFDALPVYDTKTGQYGMWDTVAGRFLENIGTGDFLGGKHITEFNHNGSIACITATDGDAPYSPIGSDDISDCGYVMHLGENKKLYLHSVKRTSPSLAVQIKNRIFYADTSSEKRGFLHIEYKGQTLSIIDD